MFVIFALTFHYQFSYVKLFTLGPNCLKIVTFSSQGGATPGFYLNSVFLLLLLFFFSGCKYCIFFRQISSLQVFFSFSVPIPELFTCSDKIIDNLCSFQKMYRFSTFQQQQIVTISSLMPIKKLSTGVMEKVTMNGLKYVQTLQKPEVFFFEDGRVVAQSIERAAPGDEVLGLITAVASCSLLVGLVSV